MKLTKEQIINYLVDVKGYSESELLEIIDTYKTSELLTQYELNECIKFNQ